MKNRPKSLIFVAACLAAIAISLPIQIMVLFGDSPFDATAIAAKLTPMNWAVLVLAATSARSVYDAAPAAKLLIPLFLAAVIWNNWLAGATALNFSPVAATSATLMVALFHLTLLHPDVLALFKNPKLRWWLMAPRAETKLKVHYRSQKFSDIQLSTFDLSSTGAFIAVETSKGLSVRNFTTGSRCSLLLQLDSKPLFCTAMIVRTSSATGKYPAGFGIRFLGLGYRQKRALADYLQKVSAGARSLADGRAVA